MLRSFARRLFVLLGLAPAALAGTVDGPTGFNVETRPDAGSQLLALPDGSEMMRIAPATWASAMVFPSGERSKRNPGPVAALSNRSVRSPLAGSRRAKRSFPPDRSMTTQLGGPRRAQRTSAS